MCVSALAVYIPCLCLVPTEVRSKHQNALELKLWIIINCRVGAGNQTPVKEQQQHFPGVMKAHEHGL